MTYNKKQPLKRILYIQYTNPAGYPPLEHSSRILGSNRWEVLFLGTGAEGANALKFAPHPQITVYQIPFCRPGWRQKLHYIKFCLWVVMWVLRWEPQWIYASDILICPLAYILTFLPQVKVIYHEHDSPTTTPESLFLRWCSQARIKLASAANFSILPNQARLEKFVSQTRTHKPVFCVWNCPDKEEVVSQRLQYRHDNDIWVLYHGSIVPERLPMTVIDAISRLPKKVKLRVIGYETLGSRGYVNKLKVVARELGFTDRLQLIEALPRKKLLKWSEQSDIGLAFMPITSDDVNLVSMTGASNKPFDYLACGLPLVVSSLPDWEQMYVEPGYGLACNPEDADSIADVLRWYLEHPTEMRVMGERGRQRILDEWNYENQFETIIKKYRDIAQMAQNYNRDFSLGIVGKYAEVANRLPPQSFILEIGCHTGYFTQFLMQNGHDVLGIEIDESASRVAVEKGCKVLCCNIENIDIQKNIDQKFDVILLMDVVEHFVYPEKILLSLKSLLKPDGKVIITGPNVGYWAVRKNLLLGRWNYSESGIMDRTHLHFYTADTWKDLLEKSGYQVVQLIPTEGMIPFEQYLSKVLKQDTLVKLRNLMIKIMPELFTIVWLIEVSPT